MSYCATIVNKMKAFITIFMLLFFFSLSSPVEAKLLPQAQGAKQTTTVKSSSGSGINVSPRLRGDRKALNVSFSNLGNASSVSYQLIYETNGQPEGAGGTISSTEASASRELLFGTCSKNVCRYHNNIKNAKFEVTYSTKSGKKYLKRYRIKV